MIRSKKKRAMVLRALKAGKRCLWDGRDTMKETEQEYICEAIAMAVRYVPLGWDEVTAARYVIMGRLDNSISLGQWLHEQGIPWGHMTNRRLQAHRHAWLDQLIEEFSKPVRGKKP